VSTRREARDVCALPELTAIDPVGEDLPT